MKSKLPLSDNLRPQIWTIAGSDSCAGAGLQADLLTAHDFAVECATAVTAITAQNIEGVTTIQPSSPELLAAQLDALAATNPAKVIKIGMLGSAELVRVVADKLATYKATWAEPPLVVCDPVLVASSGASLALDDLMQALPALLAQTDVLTPNATELASLSDIELNSVSALKQACAKLLKQGVKAVWAKGGHLALTPNIALDYFSDGQREIVLSSQMIDAPHTHGTGCTLASALASALAHDFAMEDALVLAKAYVYQGLKQVVGRGNLAHLGWPTLREHFPRVESAQTALGQQFGLSESWPEAVPFTPCDTTKLGVYPVVDSVEWIERLLNMGVKTLQLRIKDKTDAAVEADVIRAIELGHQHQARLFINDYWQLAVKHGAYGVHLGQEDLEVANLQHIAAAGLRLGISTHGYFELLRASQLQPSYIALGHIFPTTTKDMPSKPQGLAKLSRYADLMHDYPLVAIGGIDLVRAKQVWQCGVGSVAVVRAITEAADPAAAVAELEAIVNQSAAN
ncbi:bifunctional hydroxymethylpyrimidine kinase/phosphomethylpyrimidine kinase [Agarivorans sp. Toyoura001]|uniref:thiamine phosphate synthase n=1 Tax=Agarivorans sp. Toyoura001 TaxID=2283141 RepID=UPI0010E2F41B|nr:thiamine phosphate synthase [Agarivorans sp. Toyoura001]GDY26966.1 bifunctional hydroxymethylpyrimidine kinase/phosphomethylpyrimidine kinase [Agarivorans sp. Toyoura001]